jgi:hypothetical protein
MQNKESLETKSKYGFVLSLVVIAQAIIFTATIQYLKQRTSDKYEEWDQLTKTTSDYTVEYKIPSEIFENFCKADKIEMLKKLMNTGGTYDIEQTLSDVGSIRNTLGNQVSKNAIESRVFRFKQYLIEKLEEILSKRPCVNDKDMTRIKIVDAIFSFKSSELT